MVLEEAAELIDVDQYSPVIISHMSEVIPGLILVVLLKGRDTASVEPVDVYAEVIRTLFGRLILRLLFSAQSPDRVFWKKPELEARCSSWMWKCRISSPTTTTTGAEPKLLCQYVKKLCRNSRVTDVNALSAGERILR